MEIKIISESLRVLLAKGQDQNGVYYSLLINSVWSTKHLCLKGNWWILKHRRRKVYSSR